MSKLKKEISVYICCNYFIQHDEMQLSENWIQNGFQIIEFPDLFASPAQKYISSAPSAALQAFLTSLHINHSNTKSIKENLTV